jgi:hypothetical protein
MVAWRSCVVLALALVAWASGEVDVAPLDGAQDLLHLGDAAGLTKAESADMSKALKALSKSERAAVEKVDVQAYAKKNPLKGGKGTCVGKLKAAEVAARAKLAENEKISVAVTAKLKAARITKQANSNTVETLTAQIETAKTKLKSVKTEYQDLHGKALNSYDVAKTKLSNYKNQRKKVSLDSEQSKATLQTYLKYKKKYIEASADASDPATDPETKRYLKLSTNYLKQYHQAQANVKASFGRAQATQKFYFKISAKYNQESERAKTAADKVKRFHDEVTRSSESVLKATALANKNAKVVAALEKEKAKADGALSLSKAKYKSAAAQMKKEANAIHRIGAMKEQLIKMSKDAAEAVKVEKVRAETMAENAKAHGLSIKGTVTMLSLLKKKAAAAKKTGELYKKAYDLAQCGKTLSLLKEGIDLAESDDETNSSECKDDKKISEMNIAAAKAADAKIASETTRLAGLKKQKAQTAAGAKVAAEMHKASVVKAARIKTALVMASGVSRSNKC